MAWEMIMVTESLIVMVIVAVIAIMMTAMPIVGIRRAARLGGSHILGDIGGNG
jgi:hypothetical protein